MFGSALFSFILILRVIAAGVCGAFIGVERSNRSKSAGVRTHCLVAVGAALMMVISKYGFADTTAGEMGLRGSDGARIAAQVVSGIGVLGAGMIFVHKNSISGLTTAAGIWTTSGIGLAMGAGMYILAVFSTIIVVAAQLLFHKNFKWLKTPSLKAICIDDVNEPDYQSKITKQLCDIGIAVVDCSVKKDTKNNLKSYKIAIEIPDNICEDDIIDKIDYDCKIINSI